MAYINGSRTFESVTLLGVDTGEKWETIRDINLDADQSIINITTDEEGNSFALTKARVYFFLQGGDNAIVASAADIDINYDDEKIYIDTTVSINISPYYKDRTFSAILDCDYSIKPFAQLNVADVANTYTTKISAYEPESWTDYDDAIHSVKISPSTGSNNLKAGSRMVIVGVRKITP